MAAPWHLNHEFALRDRVALVSGANRGLGLEMALALVEAGARAVYCVDLPERPGGEWVKVAEYVRRMVSGAVTGRLEYVCADVRDQKAMWKVGEEIGEREGRMDVCVAAAGILKSHTDCLEYPADQFEQVISAAGRQMTRFGNGGSIILNPDRLNERKHYEQGALLSYYTLGVTRGRRADPNITNRITRRMSYNTSKSAVLQMGRSMACELGPKRIRVNTLSPGYIYTSMTAAHVDTQPHLLDKWPDELRGVITWLASDASTFCTGSDILVSGGHHAW
ncbi:sorbose reductase sou1 [Lactarius deliciosus]|nr:sorbose reductase sou1 [Lactarius deliciosus]